jgi:hypothetical protein
MLDQRGVDVGQRIAAIDLRLTRAQQIEVGAVENENGRRHGVFCLKLFALQASYKARGGGQGLAVRPGHFAPLARGGIAQIASAKQSIEPVGQAVEP